jgi:Domain of unknown function (DUF4062)
VDGKIYKVFVSSTYDDLREERAAIQKALLQLDCLPVGMELFPAADEETWDFIKSQIDDADYYVVVVAGRYGSVAPDGISFTEKEYDYALAKKKPAIGFIHGQPGSIAVERTEKLPERQSKLESLLHKIKQRPVRPFTNPHELALEVTTSFVKLIDERPSEGYVRSSEAVEYKRYATLLEENNALKEQLKTVDQSLNIPLFKGHDRNLKLVVTVSRLEGSTQQNGLFEPERSLKTIFGLVAEAILQDDEEYRVLQAAAKLLANKGLKGWTIDGFDENTVRQLRRLLQLYGLIEVSRETISRHDYIRNVSAADTVNLWRLTDYGRSQLRAMTGE